MRKIIKLLCVNEGVITDHNTGNISCNTKPIVYEGLIYTSSSDKYIDQYGQEVYKISELGTTKLVSRFINVEDCKEEKLYCINDGLILNHQNSLHHVKKGKTYTSLTRYIDNDGDEVCFIKEVKCAKLASRFVSNNEKTIIYSL